jgi:hypothetical protein
MGFILVDSMAPVILYKRIPSTTFTVNHKTVQTINKEYVLVFQMDASNIFEAIGRH